MVTPVSITHQFNGDTAAADLVDAAELDTQLASLAATVNAEIAERQRTIRDGSGLQAQVVRYPSLHPEITALLTAGGLIPLQGAAVVATSNVASLTGLLTIDGYTVIAGDRALLIGQTNPLQNGLWVAAAGAWTRPADSATGSAVSRYSMVNVTGGTLMIGTSWMLNAAVASVDSSAQTWVLYSTVGGITPISRGGTGASDVVTARTNLGLGALAVLSSVAQANLAADVHYQVDTVAALRALTSGSHDTVLIRGYYATGDIGGGGVYRWNSADATADNGGTVIRPGSLPATGRWNLLSAFNKVLPERFGAKGDGVTDDTAAMAAAMTYADLVGMQIDLAPSATYLLNTWTAFSNASSLAIAGNGATVRGPATTVDFLSPAANFRIMDVKFDRWNSVVERLRASTGSYTLVRFERNTVTNCDGLAFNIERPIEAYFIRDNLFSLCTGGYVIRIGENTYANQDDYKKGAITGNVIKDISASGATSLAAILVYGKEVDISENVIDGVTQSGTGEAWGIYTKTRYGQVRANRINNVVAAGNADNVGINIKGNTRAVVTAPQGYAMIVIGNHVRNVGSAGVRGTGIRAQTDDVQIIGNQVENPGLTGIGSDEATAYFHVLADRNTVRWAALVAATTGVRLTGGGSRVVASGNMILRATVGVYIQADQAAVPLTDVAAIDNVMDGCTYGVLYDAQAGCSLVDCRLSGNAVTGGTAAILFNGSAGTITRLTITGNDLARPATPHSGALATGSIVRDNYGWMQGTAVYDPANLADGAGVTTTVAVSFAALGDTVAVSFSLDLQGILLTAYVSAVNVVSVRFQNETGGPIDLGSGTLKVRIAKS